MLRLPKIPLRDVGKIDADMSVPVKRQMIIERFKETNHLLFWDCVEWYALIARRCERHGDLFLYGAISTHEAYRREFERRGRRLPFVEEGTLESMIDEKSESTGARTIKQDCIFVDAGIVAVRYCLRHGTRRTARKPLRLEKEYLHNLYKQARGTVPYREMER